MANLYRVSCVVLVWVVLVLLSLNAQATVGKTNSNVTEYKVGTTGWYTSQAAAASAFQAQAPTSNGSNVQSFGGVPYACRTFPSSGQQCEIITTRTVSGSPACPSGSTEVGGLCYCNDGFKDGADGTSCEADPDAGKCSALSGSVDNSYNRSYGSSSTSDVCPAVGAGSKCTVSITWDTTYSVNGVRQQSGVGKYSGKTCSATTTANATAATPVPTSAVPLPPAPGAPGAPAPNPCPKGTYPGTVNGVSVCVPPSSSEPVSTTKTTTTTTPAPPGSPSSAPSTASTTANTTCTGSTCTTTTTTTTTSGGDTPTSTSTTTQQPKDDYCTTNPKSTQCIESTYGGGTCFSAPPACSGDAIQCAIALQSWQTACALNPSATAESQAYDAAKTQTGSVTGDLPGSESVAIGSTSFDQTAHFTAVGLADLNLTVVGNDVTIKLSALNTWLELLGNLGVAVTLLVAIRISLGGAV